MKVAVWKTEKEILGVRKWVWKTKLFKRLRILSDGRLEG